jgi:hypothetical protein
MSRARLTVPPHGHQPTGYGVMPHLDPCGRDGCGMPPAHHIHHVGDQPVRDLTEPVHQREEGQT